MNKYDCFSVVRRAGKWYAVNTEYAPMGGTRLKRELMEFMEEQFNADVIGDAIYVPMKMFN